MNKTQINWCRDRIDTIMKQKESVLRNTTAFLSELSVEQKLSQLQNGKAKIMVEKYADADRCPYGMGKINEMFEWDGEAEIIAHNDAISKKMEIAIEKMRVDGEDILDRFVLGEITEAKALKDFKAKKYKI